MTFDPPPHQPPPPPPPPPPPFPGYGYNNIAVSAAVGFGSHPTTSFMDLFPPLKRQRNSSGGVPPSIHRHIPNNNNNNNNIIVNNEKNRLFYKTRLCAKFKAGSCPYGGNCSFAHGLEELRNCHRYHSQEGCPRFSQDPDGPRESSAVDHTFSSVWTANKRGNPPAVIAGAIQKPTPSLNYKTCNNWEMSGRCSYGDKCIYAHAQPVDLRSSISSFTTEPIKYGGTVVAESVDISNSIPSHSPVDLSSPSHGRQVHRRKELLKQKGVKWMSRIYADWIEDGSP